MTRDEVLELASVHADIEKDRRGRLWIDMDDLGLLSIWNAAMERAAKVADAAGDKEAGVTYYGCEGTARDIAYAIRAEKVEWPVCR